MQFTRYPVVVDPASYTISLREQGEPAEGKWRHLSRLQHSDAAPFVVDNSRVHIFGDASTIDTSQFLLCYDTAGFLTEVYRRTGSQWVRHEVPEEVSGRPILHPSVRFTFSTTEDRAAFLSLLQRMGAAVRSFAIPDPADAHQLVTIVLRQPVAPRLVDVAALAAHE